MGAGPEVRPSRVRLRNSKARVCAASESKGEGVDRA